MTDSSGRKGWLDRLIPPLLKALDSALLLRKNLHFRNGSVQWDDFRHPLRPDRVVYLLGAGKASAQMAAEAERILGEAVSDGMIVTKYGHGRSGRKVRIVEAGHPIPDPAGERGAKEIAALARRARQGDLVIGLWSGGGSALLPMPVDGVSLGAKRRVTDLLLRSGAAIGEINAVRKHLSQIKGGRLAEAVGPARMVNFILSDVVGDPLDVIASGPTVPDRTTYASAVEILKRYSIWGRVDRSVRAALREGLAGKRPETPKRLPRRIENRLIGNGALAVAELARRAEAIGWRPQVLTSVLEGEAREAAKVLVSLAEEQRRKKRGDRPVCLIAGGETTVTVRGRGKGGRCQEFVLAAALALAGKKGMTAAAFSTDGSDGPTDAAGAVATGETVRRAARLGSDPRRALQENDAYRFFDPLGDLIRTGPTRTHLNDLYFILVE